MSQQPIFSFRGTKYKITYKGEGIQDEQWFLSQLEYAREQNDWVTVQNKLNNGIMWGHITEL